MDCRANFWARTCGIKPAFCCQHSKIIRTLRQLFSIAPPKYDNRQLKVSRKVTDNRAQRLSKKVSSFGNHNGNGSTSHPDIPNHIAIIMDGNGRWASERGCIASVGHKAGIEALEKTVEGCVELGVQYLTVFALSTENNSSRDDQEVKFLIGLVYSVINDRLQKLHAEGVKLKFIGNTSSLDDRQLCSAIARYAIYSTLIVYLINMLIS